MLQGLDAADVNLDCDGGKTESILKCVEYSHGNLSAEAQKLLLCLAPFSGFIRRDLLGIYASELQKLEAFQDYPFEQFDEAVQEAIDWGLLAPIEVGPGLTIQPVFPYFLRTKLAQQDATVREALREGFKNHYLEGARAYNQLMESKDAKEKELGVFFCRMEYENLYRALQICLERQDSISIFACLDKYFELIEDPKNALKLAEEVYQAVEQYPNEWKTDGENIQYQLVLNLVACCYFDAKQYSEARGVYQKELNIEEIKGDRHSQATTYHQLGYIAQELREYEEARVNYQQSLRIKAELNDRYSQAMTYHQLGRVAQELREYEEARVNYQKALQIFVEFNDRYSQASTYGQLGLLAEAEGNPAEAINCLQKALEIFTEFGDEHSMGITRGNLARAVSRKDEG